MLKIRRPLGRLIFNMGIAIPGKTVFLIETAPWESVRLSHSASEATLNMIEYYPVRQFDNYQNKPKGRGNVRILIKLLIHVWETYFWRQSLHIQVMICSG